MAIENDTISPGAILDWIYCRRRWYLRHMEGTEEKFSVSFVEGQMLHEDVDIPSIKRDGNNVYVTDVGVFNHEYGLYGVADMVLCVPAHDGVSVPWLSGGLYQVIPVEVKHGKVRDCMEYRAQVVAYALCLEEMFGTTVETGQILFDNSELVEFSIDARERNVVMSAISNIRYAMEHQFFIQPMFGRKCYHCVMREQCDAKNARINEYMETFWSEL